MSVDGAGVQVASGGLEPGKTPTQAAIRELREESGLGIADAAYLCSYLWRGEPPEAFKHPARVAHAYAFKAPDDLPDAWQRHTDDHLFSFRWADLKSPGLDWGRRPSPTS